MLDSLVLAAYGAAIVLAVGTLYRFGPRRWYWHALSIALAIVLGIVPLPEAWHTPYHDLAVSAGLLFLFVWGVAAPLAPYLRVFHRLRLSARAAVSSLMCVCACNLLFSTGLLFFSPIAVVVVVIDAAIFALAVMTRLRPQRRIVSAAGWLAVVRGSASLAIMFISWLVDPKGFYGEGTLVLQVYGTLVTLQILFGWRVLGERHQRAEEAEGRGL